MEKVDLPYTFLYSRLRKKFKGNFITLKQLKDFLSQDFAINHLTPKNAHRGLIEEMEENGIVKKLDSLNYQILDRRDLLKKVIKFNIGF